MEHIKKYIYRDVSWLSFNGRVLQEANDPTVPLIERIKFLGIFSNNRDEFFRVRIATLKRMIALGKKTRTMLGGEPAAILNSIQRIVRRQGKKFDDTYVRLLQELEQNDIFIIDEHDLSPDQGMYIRNYFQQEVRPTLIPIMIDQVRELPNLKEYSAYFAIEMILDGNSQGRKYSLIELPTEVLPRFCVLPPQVREKNTLFFLTM